ncbi:MAG TPA: glycosyltransferase family 2 protein [Ktedonobacteraceae bacterium]|nr:glycosyltransferase family 2 protein [Ktedonobacteraceae bacterium]
MLAIYVLRWLLIVSEVMIALPILYLCALSVSAVLAARRQGAAQASDGNSTPPQRIRFAVLIPAHNEEGILGTLLASLTALDYPKKHYSVYVVADNCTDRTAEIARSTGWAHVYERFDVSKRGKGYALSWVLQQLENKQAGYDAYVVLDADSIIDPAFLRAMERELRCGAQSLQAYNGVLNSADSPSTALRWIALALVNHVRPLGRTGLGCSSTLTGNGMCLRRSLLQRYPWESFGLAEDYHYYLTLLEHGERVRYVPEAVVRSHMPTSFAQMRTQDIRWESSAGGRPLWRVVARLIMAGIKYHDRTPLEGVVELLTPPLSLLVGWSVLDLVASLCLWWSPGLLVSLALIAGLIGYISSPLYLLKPPRPIYLSLVYAPGFIAWKLWVYFVLRKQKKLTSEWVRTTRIAS